MNSLEARFSKSIHKEEIEQIAHQVVAHPNSFEALYTLTKHPKKEVSWRALWACQWVCEMEGMLLLPKLDELTERAISSSCQTQKRLLMRMILILPTSNPINIKLLDFCLEAMVDRKTAVATQALCIKIAYKLCLEEPELLDELALCLESIEPEYYTAAVRATRKEILNKIHKYKIRKRIQ